MAIALVDHLPPAAVATLMAELIAHAAGEEEGVVRELEARTSPDVRSDGWLGRALRLIAVADSPESRAVAQAALALHRSPVAVPLIARALGLAHEIEEPKNVGDLVEKVLRETDAIWRRGPNPAKTIARIALLLPAVDRIEPLAEAQQLAERLAEGAVAGGDHACCGR